MTESNLLLPTQGHTAAVVAKEAYPGCEASNSGRQRSFEGADWEQLSRVDSTMTGTEKEAGSIQESERLKKGGFSQTLFILLF